MNKLCLPFRHLFFIFLAFISLSFCFTPEVKADNITITYSDFTPVSSSTFDIARQNVINLGHPYVIYLQSPDLFYAYVYSNDPSGPGSISRSYDSVRFRLNSFAQKYVLNMNTGAIEYVGSSTNPYIDVKTNLNSSSYIVLDTNLTWNNNGTYPIDITNGTDIETCSVYTLCNKVSLYSWYEATPPEPPVPPDETPLLTSFYSITIDRLSYLCDYITDSYVYLAIFTIFILYFVILLIRRLR